ncbi:hypothetical protein AGABI1DRAFT_87842 [Agaricus bisporus var. burnettii JB137-S8]|uniref:Nudix hydrolase domain-containing protein n=1 Tax=Agaricus bisporus var. burnettii (strain JB137-S8 / ATCC MYA-4627 / FGSC 10392) TaxID=597362 RepID=K5WXQ2_AGABU|nr:uncharacterized protein AGABI1DRAFT_87842 [Agaricus bisporus var. burnettii JB137-S8]EKM75372.1 hypothetical protein AGABI1DRAFT_87842 [Agaricus bisporus var. burnettii JB137-S8]
MNFTLGVGMVLIQQSTNKIVVVHESSKGYWFFPRGRKDLGESLEAAALREAYEESGYRAELMPVYNPSRAPAPPGERQRYEEPNKEPVYMTTTAAVNTVMTQESVNMTTLASVNMEDYHTRSPDKNLGYEYLVSWYIGQIPADAIPERGTGMPDEVDYVSHLLDYDRAMDKVYGFEREVLRYAWAVYTHTLEVRNRRVGEAGGQKESVHGAA